MPEMPARFVKAQLLHCSDDRTAFAEVPLHKDDIHRDIIILRVQGDNGIAGENNINPLLHQMTLDVGSKLGLGHRPH
jgi:hypothetical protein